MKSIIKILGIIMILAVVSLSGCIGEDVPAENESDVVVIDEPVDVVVDEPVSDEPEDEDDHTPLRPGGLRVLELLDALPFPVLPGPLVAERTADDCSNDAQKER